jgi:hypothetical protein
MLSEPEKETYKLEFCLTQSYEANQINVNTVGYLLRLFWGSWMLVCAFSSAVQMVALFAIQSVLSSHIHQFYPVQEIS